MLHDYITSREFLSKNNVICVPKQCVYCRAEGNVIDVETSAILLHVMPCDAAGTRDMCDTTRDLYLSSCLSVSV